MTRLHVLMCCHNGAAFVTEQLQSILMQQHPIDMVHVHDFASKDNTVACVDSLAHGSAVPINVTRHADAPGAALSFFRGLHAVSTQLADDDLLFLADQDDVWLPNKTSSVMRKWAETDAAVRRELAIFHDVKVVDQSLTVQRSTYYTGDPWALPRDLDPARLLLGNPVIGHTLAVTGGLVRRVVRMARPREYLMHDWSLVLFASRFGHIRFIPEALSLYRQHDSNVLGAYGRRSPLQVFGRVSRFADEVVQQAIAFIQDTAPEAEQLIHSSSLDRRLFRVARRTPLSSYPLLALQSLLRGPTPRRKGLGLFIAAQGARRCVLRRNGSGRT